MLVKLENEAWTIYMLVHVYYEGQLSSDLGTSEDVYTWTILESQAREVITSRCKSYSLHI